jgi:hypothetical protein
VADTYASTSDADLESSNEMTNNSQNFVKNTFEGVYSML